VGTEQVQVWTDNILYEPKLQVSFFVRMEDLGDIPIALSLFG
jgi:hypothetical protein